MQIESVPVGSLVLDPTNARKHDAKNLEAIKGSLAKFGMQKPIVVTEDNVVIAGNGTLEAAKALGWEKVDIHRTVLKGAEAMAYALADNRTAELADWDADILKEQIGALSMDGWDVGDFGFDLDDFDIDAGGTEGNTDPDDVPEVEENIHKVERGQIWQLGEHRLMCGDSTSKDDVEKLMAGEKADMVFTDPPYGIDLNTDVSKVFSKGTIADAKKWKKIEGDGAFFDVSFILEFFSGCKEIFVWGANYLGLSGTYMVWDKVCQRYDGRPCVSDFELVWSKQRHQQKICYLEWIGFVGKTKDDGNRVHPTQKPVGLAEWFFERWGKGLTNIVDLFLGSGSTLIACEKTGRKCFSSEIDPHYCSVAIERYMNFTGRRDVYLLGDNGEKQYIDEVQKMRTRV